MGYVLVKIFGDCLVCWLLRLTLVLSCSSKKLYGIFNSSMCFRSLEQPLYLAVRFSKFSIYSIIGCSINLDSI